MLHFERQEEVMKKTNFKIVAVVLICGLVAALLVACNGEQDCISKIEKAGYNVTKHCDADKYVNVSYTEMANGEGQKVYIVSYMSVSKKTGKAKPSVSKAKKAFGDGLIPSGMIDNPNIPKGNRFVFVNSPYSGYGDGAVRVGNSIIVGPMEILKQLQKNDNKILAKTPHKAAFLRS